MPRPQTREPLNATCAFVRVNRYRLRRLGLAGLSSRWVRVRVSGRVGGGGHALTSIFEQSRQDFDRNLQFLPVVRRTGQHSVTVRRRCTQLRQFSWGHVRLGAPKMYVQNRSKPKGCFHPQRRFAPIFFPRVRPVPGTRIQRSYSLTLVVGLFLAIPSPRLVRGTMQIYKLSK